MSVNLSREVIRAEFEKLVERIFSLPETAAVRVRKVTVCREQDSAQRADAIQSIMEESFHDILSDIDLRVVVKHLPGEVACRMPYIRRIDRYGITRENVLGIALMNEDTYRILLKNGMRYDFGFEFQEEAGAVSLATILEQNPIGESAVMAAEPDEEQERIDRFWFMMIQALGKLYRRDYLMGDHLASMCINETLVQQMVLRDRKYGTNHHRYGYREELVYRRFLEQGCPYREDDETFCVIAAKLYAAALAEDEMTRMMYPQQDGRAELLFDVWDAYAEEV